MGESGGPGAGEVIGRVGHLRACACGADDGRGVVVEIRARLCFRLAQPGLVCGQVPCWRVRWAVRWQWSSYRAASQAYVWPYDNLGRDHTAPDWWEIVAVGIARSVHGGRTLKRWG